MRRITLLRNLLMLLMISLIGPLAANAEAAGPSIAASHDGSRVVWSVQQEYAEANLSVAMPDGTVVERRFGSQAEISFAPVDVVDAGSIEGLYTWQLTLTPILDASTREALVAARAAGDAGRLEALRAEGALPQPEDLVSSGSFRVANRSLVSDAVVEPPSELAATKGSEALPDRDVPTRDNVILDDLIVDGSACVGFDCVNGESFGFDTFRLKENNLRIHFQDTSTSASFPTNDWRIIANDSANGGDSYLAFEDSDNARRIFQVDAGGPANSLRVDDRGRVGLGTATPYVELHINDNDTPTVRLEQNGSSGWSPQTWDVAGNETNFFIRDVTTGSKLPFRIRPGAPSNSIYIDPNGDVGFGSSSPSAQLDVVSDGVEVARFANNGNVKLILEDTGGGGSDNKWVLNNAATLRFAGNDPATAQMTLDTDGNLVIQGSLTASGSVFPTPDYVFEPDYKLMPLNELDEFIRDQGHLPSIPSTEEIRQARGVNMTEMQLRLLEKIEELTLYTIQQQETIAGLEARLADLEKSEIE